MQINPQIQINPGIIEYDAKRHKKISNFMDAVRNARFLSENEKKNWSVLAYILTNEQIDQVVRLVINEDLKRLKTKEALEKIKPIEK